MIRYYVSYEAIHGKLALYKVLTCSVIYCTEYILFNAFLYVVFAPRDSACKSRTLNTQWITLLPIQVQETNPKSDFAAESICAYARRPTYATDHSTRPFSTIISDKIQCKIFGTVATKFHKNPRTIRWKKSSRDINFKVKRPLDTTRSVARFLCCRLLRFLSRFQGYTSVFSLGECYRNGCQQPSMPPMTKNSHFFRF